MTRAADLIRADWDAIEARWDRGEIDLDTYARETFRLADLLDQTTVPVERRDVSSAISALTRWADECVPGSDGYLRQVIARLKKALDA